MIRNRMTRYIAPDGYLYDWAEPHNNSEGEEEHLWVKQLYLTKFDSIDNYKLVQDSREALNNDN